jgi:hypothetical protein
VAPTIRRADIRSDSSDGESFLSDAAKELMATLRWVRAVRLDELESGRPRVFEVEGRFLAVFLRDSSPAAPQELAAAGEMALDLASESRDSADGGSQGTAPRERGSSRGETQISCVENLCPRDGKSQPQGFAKSCLADCDCGTWILDESSCGSDSLQLPRSYRTRVRDGWVEVALTEESREDRIRGARRQLGASLREGALSSAMRALVQLLHEGVEPYELVRYFVKFDTRHSPNGAGALSMLAIDTLRFVHEWPGLRFCLPMAQVLDLAIRSHVRREARTPAKARGQVERVEFAKRLLELVEERDAAGAEALGRAALERGASILVIEQALYQFCSKHFVDAGAALIAVHKTFELLRRHPSSAEIDIVCGLIRRVTTGQRHEESRSWGGYRWRVDRISQSRYAVPRPSQLLHYDWGDEELQRRVLNSRAKDAFDAVCQAWSRGVPAGQIAGSLVAAAAERILRFDDRIDLDAETHEGWLSVVERILFANSVMQVVERCDEGSALRLLLQSAHYICEAAPLDGDFENWGFAPGLESGLETGRVVDELLDAVQRRRPREALHWGAVWLEREVEPFEMRRVLAERVFDDHFQDPEHVRFAVAFLLDAMDLLAWYGNEPAGRLSVLALLRFLSSRQRERSLRRIAVESMRYVSEGRLPSCRT